MTTFFIDTPPDFNYMPTVWSHGWYMLAPFTFDEAQKVLYRVHQLRNGQVVRIAAAPQDADRRLAITITGLPHPISPAHQQEIGAVVSRCLGLDQDLTAFYAWLDGYPRYAWVKQAGAGRMMVSASVWEDLAKTLLTTNTTWRMTIHMVERLCALGQPFENAFAFPTPERIAALELDTLNAHVRAGYRGAYLHELARKICDGLDVESWYDDTASGDELYKRIRSLKGFGDYAAGALLRLLKRHDRLSIDTVCRDVYKKQINQGASAADAEIRAYYAPFDQWRGLAQWMDVMWSWLKPGE